MNLVKSVGICDLIFGEAAARRSFFLHSNVTADRGADTASCTSGKIKSYGRSTDKIPPTKLVKLAHSPRQPCTPRRPYKI